MLRQTMGEGFAIQKVWFKGVGVGVKCGRLTTEGGQTTVEGDLVSILSPEQQSTRKVTNLILRLTTNIFRSISVMIRELFVDFCEIDETTYQYKKTVDMGCPY